jgi:hypothetical protein
VTVGQASGLSGEDEAAEIGRSLRQGEDGEERDHVQ